MPFIKNRKLMFFTTVAIVAIILFSVTSITSADSGNNEDTPLAKIYAERYGVTVDEALHRLKLQNAFPDLEPEIMKNEPDTFGGLWLQHEPEFKVIVAFTGNGENTITRYYDYIPKEITPYIEVINVEKSLVALLDDQENLAQSMEAQGIRADSWLNLFDNRVEVNVRISDKSTYDLAVNQGKIIQPDRLNINLVESLTQQETDIYGGLKLRNWVPLLLHATSGFSVTKDSTGEVGIITAAHADNGLWYGTSSLTYEDEEYGGSYDVQWHTHSSLNFTNEIQIDDLGNTREIDGVITRDQLPLGNVCVKYGQKTGYTVGRLASKTFRPEGRLPNPNATWMLVSNDFNYDDLSGGGDSGCPWFTSSYALGIHHGSCIIGEEQHAVFMAIEYINTLGLEVMTD